MQLALGAGDDGRSGSGANKIVHQQLCQLTSPVTLLVGACKRGGFLVRGAHERRFQGNNIDACGPHETDSHAYSEDDFPEHATEVVRKWLLIGKHGMSAFHSKRT